MRIVKRWNQRGSGWTDRQNVVDGRTNREAEKQMDDGWMDGVMGRLMCI